VAVGHSSAVTSYDTHGCTRAITTRYTTLDATIEIGSRSAKVE